MKIVISFWAAIGTVILLAIARWLHPAVISAPLLIAVATATAILGIIAAKTQDE